ncbi:MAG: hypothetical protein P4M05_19300 [Bradyrhizobium sp.]|nr:hypothetical protein [Bradyrhizobium sp.]
MSRQEGRARPASKIFGISFECRLTRPGDTISIDGETGAVYLGPIAAAAAADPYLGTLQSRNAEAATAG